VPVVVSLRTIIRDHAHRVRERGRRGTRR
jgi:hypothetical protein